MVKRSAAKSLKKIKNGNNLALIVNHCTFKTLCWKQTAESLILSSSSPCVSRQAWDI